MVVVTCAEVDLSSHSGSNDLVVMKIADGSHAAGGRGGGFGERRVSMVARFRCAEGAWQKLFETRSEAEADTFEVPYSVARLPIVLMDGTETMGYGVVDEESVRTLTEKTDAASSP